MAAIVEARRDDRHGIECRDGMARLAAPAASPQGARWDDCHSDVDNNVERDLASLSLNILIISVSIRPHGVGQEGSGGVQFYVGFITCLHTGPLFWMLPHTCLHICLKPLACSALNCL